MANSRRGLFAENRITHPEDSIEANYENYHQFNVFCKCSSCSNHTPTDDCSCAKCAWHYSDGMGVPFNSCVHTHDANDSCICVICVQKWRGRNYREKQPIYGITGRLHRNCSRRACQTCITKRTYRLRQRDTMCQPHDEPVPFAKICHKCQECAKYESLCVLSRLYPHFDTCPCAVCSERRIKHFPLEQCDCLACKRASFGRCTAELYAKIQIVNQRLAANRERRNRRNMMFDMNPEYWIERQQQNEYSSEDSHAGVPDYDSDD